MCIIIIISDLKIAIIISDRKINIIAQLKSIFAIHQKRLMSIKPVESCSEQEK